MIKYRIDISNEIIIGEFEDSHDAAEKIIEMDNSRQSLENFFMFWSFLFVITFIGLFIVTAIGNPLIITIDIILLVSSIGIMLVMFIKAFNYEDEWDYIKIASIFDLIKISYSDNKMFKQQLDLYKRDLLGELSSSKMNYNRVGSKKLELQNKNVFDVDIEAEFSKCKEKYEQNKETYDELLDCIALVSDIVENEKDEVIDRIMFHKLSRYINFEAVGENDE